jgi:hypothetical protein
MLVRSELNQFSLTSYAKVYMLALRATIDIADRSVCPLFAWGEARVARDRVTVSSWLKEGVWAGEVGALVLGWL